MKLKIVNSTVKDGNMGMKFGSPDEVIHNRTVFLNKNNINNLIKITPLYKDNIFILVDNDIKNGEIEADCIITNVPNLFLYLYFADCIPMTLFDKQNNILAFAHMGWQSVELNLHKKIIEKMIDEFNSNVKDIEVYLGPSIKKSSYILKTPSQLKNKDWHPFLKEVKKDYYQIDLSGYIVDLLKKLSIENIYVSPIDTAIDEEYYSHYRCTYIKPDEKEGRFIAGAMMEKN